MVGIVLALHEAGGWDLVYRSTLGEGEGGDDDAEVDAKKIVKLHEALTGIFARVGARLPDLASTDQTPEPADGEPA
jgi:hypothetical protein